jgi:hypothetical protein
MPLAWSMALVTNTVGCELYVLGDLEAGPASREQLVLGPGRRWWSVVP